MCKSVCLGHGLICVEPAELGNCKLKAALHFCRLSGNAVHRHMDLKKMGRVVGKEKEAGSRGRERAYDRQHKAKKRSRETEQETNERKACNGQYD